MKPATRLILVKHSMPGIVENVPAREWTLSDEGRIRARMLVEKLTQYQPEVVVSSDEPKAQQTAEIIGESFGLKFRTAKGLHEHDRIHVPFYENDVFQSFVQKLFEEPDVLVFGGETANQALVRFRDAVDLIWKSSNGKTALIVSHGTVISLFVSWLTGMNGYLLWRELGLPSFVVLDIKSRKLLANKT